MKSKHFKNRKSCGCPETKPDPCCEPVVCGCKIKLSTKCVINDLKDYECLGYQKGDSLDKLIDILEEKCLDSELLNDNEVCIENIGNGKEFYAGISLEGIHQIRTLLSPDSSIKVETKGDEIHISINKANLLNIIKKLFEENPEFLRDIINNFINSNIDIFESIFNNLISNFDFTSIINNYFNENPSTICGLLKDCDFEDNCEDFEGSGPFNVTNSTINSDVISNVVQTNNGSYLEIFFTNNAPIYLNIDALGVGGDFTTNTLTFEVLESDCEFKANIYFANQIISNQVNINGPGVYTLTFNGVGTTNGYYLGIVGSSGCRLTIDNICVEVNAISGPSNKPIVSQLNILGSDCCN